MKRRRRRTRRNPIFALPVIIPTGLTLLAGLWMLARRPNPTPVVPPIGVGPLPGWRDLWRTKVAPIKPPSETPAKDFCLQLYQRYLLAQRFGDFSTINMDALKRCADNRHIPNY